MSQILTISQIIVAVLMVVGILMQSSGSGLGSAFGGGGDVYLTKRGAEKTIFVATIVMAALFILLGAVRLFI